MKKPPRKDKGTRQQIRVAQETLALLKNWPDTPERTQQELLLHMTVIGPLMAAKGEAAPEVERAYVQIWELYRQLGETEPPFWVVFGRWVVHLVRGELRTARQLGERLMSLAQKRADPALLLWAHHVLGMSSFWVGEFTAARTRLEQVIALYDSQSHPRYMVDPKMVCLSYGAQVLWFLVQFQHTSWGYQGEQLYEAELYRLRGTLTLQKFQVPGSKSQVPPSPQSLTPNSQAEAEAEECFWKAIEIAKRQQAKSLELRAVMSLSRLWLRQGKKDEARRMLAETYGWFTEGFDTPDLQEARALLDELGD